MLVAVFIAILNIAMKTAIIMIKHSNDNSNHRDQT
jgi:hypothetical protein